MHWMSVTNTKLWKCASDRSARHYYDPFSTSTKRVHVVVNTDVPYSPDHSTISTESPAIPAGDLCLSSVPARNSRLLPSLSY
jgi:hypothetical protein